MITSTRSSISHLHQMEDDDCLHEITVTTEGDSVTLTYRFGDPDFSVATSGISMPTELAIIVARQILADAGKQ